MSDRTYKNISIKSEFAEAIEKFIRQNPQLGYRSIAAFLEDSSRRRLEELKAIEDQLPRMEQVNFDENGVKIHDRRLHRVADVNFSPKGIRCALCKKDECEHITLCACSTGNPDRYTEEEERGLETTRRLRR